MRALEPEAVDAIFAAIEPLLPEPHEHPLGCHRPRIADRLCVWGILVRLTTRSSWADIGVHTSLTDRETIVGLLASGMTSNEIVNDYSDSDTATQPWLLREYRLERTGPRFRPPVRLSGSGCGDRNQIRTES